MAITFSNKVHDLDAKTDPRTFSFTNTASTNALMVLILYVRTATARAGGAPTYNGVAMTQAGTTIVHASGLAVEIWYLVAPATGANTVSIPNTNAENIAADASSYENAAQTSVLNTSNGATGDSTAPSAAVTTSARCVVISGHCHESTDASSNVQGVLLFATDEGTWDTGGHYLIQTSAGAQTMSWSNPRSDIWAIKVVAFNPYVVTQALSASAGTTVALSTQGLFKRTLATAAVSAVALSRLLSLSQVLSVTAVAVPTISRFVSIFKTLSASAGTVASLSLIRIYSRTLTTSAVTVASLAKKAIHKRTLATAAVSVSALSTVAVHFKALAASAVTVAAMFTKGVSLILKNAANALVTNTLVKWAIMEYGGGTPSDADFMSVSNKGTDWTDSSGALKVPYSGATAKGGTVYVAVIHPDTTPTESMIWQDTIK